jgi:hypothetical protein
MTSVLPNALNDAPQWTRAIEGKYGNGTPFTKKDWDKLLGNSQALCDLPGALFATELAQIYPEAKLVILNRDPEAWYESVLETVNKAMGTPGPVAMARLIFMSLFDEESRVSGQFFRAMVTLGLPFDHAKEKDKAIAWFKEQYSHFRENVPAERCLEFSVKDGWEPLCKFLDVPVPTVRDEKTGELEPIPFPRVNDRASFKKGLPVMHKKGMARARNNMFALIGRVAVTGAAVYGGYMVWKTRLGGRF